ncbi:MAG TPA: hypothetical protein VF042_15540 [Gemmatimonadaceae bacterium]
MHSLRRSTVLTLAALALGACSESPTTPTNVTTMESLGTAAVVDPTLVTFNSASCTLTSSVTGIVNCSWNISNPAQEVVNLSATALLDVSYDCVNPKNGRVQSSETTQLRTFRVESGVFSTSLTGTNVALPWLILPTDFSGSLKKQNACKGNHVPQNAEWSLNYWDVSVITTTGTPRMSCFASDNRNGCFTI